MESLMKKATFGAVLALLACFAQSSFLTAQAKEKKLSVAELIAQLGDAKDSQKRYDAYRELQAEKPKKALALLAAALPTFPYASQSLGLSLLQSYPYEKSRPFRKKLMSCGVPFLELGAAVSFVREGDSSAVKVIIAALIKAKDDARTLASMIRRMGYVKNKEVQDQVRSLLRPATASTVISAALYYLQAAEGLRAKERALQLADSADTDIQSRAFCEAYLLGTGMNSRSENIAKLLRENRVSLSSLYTFLQKAPRMDKPLLEYFLESLEEKKQGYEVRYAIGFLAKHRYSKAVAQIRKLMTSSDSTVAEAATEAISKMSGGLRPEDLYKQLSSDNNALVLTAADTLRKLDDYTGLPRVLEILKEDQAKEYAAIQVLVGFRSKKVIEPLLDALLSKNLSVRSTALSGIRRIWQCFFPYKRFNLEASGYRYNGPETSRTAAVAKFRAWWKKNQGVLR